MNVFARWIVSLAVLAPCLALTAYAQNPEPIKLSDGHIMLTPPEKWTSKKPSTRIVDYEFSVSPAEGDTKEARVTIMGAGGGVEQNVARWMAQFTQADGKPTSSRTKKEEKKIAGQTVHVVDIQGDYRNPFRPSDSGANFRMLGAIIETEKLGQYFVKLYGPMKTVDANEKAFNTMIESLKVK